VTTVEQRSVHSPLAARQRAARGQSRLAGSKHAGKLRQGPVGKVQVVAMADQLEAEFRPKRPQRLRRVDRHMPVAWRDIPPVQARSQEVRRLHQCREHDDALLLDQAGDLEDRGAGIGRVLQHLEAGDEREQPVGPPLRANDDETSSPREFSLEGAEG